MLGIVAVFHIIFVVALIVLVLLQDSKGGALGAFGGGGSNSIFGTGGGANFLSSATKVISICFAVTCLTLAYMTNTKSDSVIDNYIPAANTQQQPVDAPADKAEKADATKAEKPAEQK